MLQRSYRARRNDPLGADRQHALQRSGGILRSLFQLVLRGAGSLRNARYQRIPLRDALCQYCDILRGGNGGLPDILPENAPKFVADYYSYYKQPRGYHERSVNSNGGWAKVSALSYMNTHLLSTVGEIDSPVMLVHGEKAHSRYFSETAFKQLSGDNKSLVIVPGASHVDLYDRTDVIPFNQIEDFFKVNLK